MDKSTANSAFITYPPAESNCSFKNEHLLISQVYTEGLFNNFIRFCASHNYQVMGDLKSFDFHSLIDIRGFGQERINKIISKYNILMFDNDSMAAVFKAHITKDSLIEEAFSENKYNIFRKYCSEKGYQCVADLANLEFDELLEVDGIGAGKLTQIRAKYDECLLAEDNIKIDTGHSAEEPLINPTYNIHSDYKGIDVSFIYAGKVCKILRKKGMNTIPDLSGISAHLFREVPGMGAKRISEELERIKLFELPLIEFITASFSKIRNEEEEYQCYREVVYNKKTLDEVGRELGVTRERIRQKKVKVEQFALPTVALFEEITVRNGSLGNIYSFNLETLSDLIGSYDNAAFAKDIVINCPLKHIRYSKDFDLFFVDKDPGQITKKIKAIVGELGVIFSFDEEMLRIEELLIQEGLEFIDIFDLPNLFEKMGYTKYSDYYIKGRPSLERLFHIILKKYFASGIDNCPEDISLLREFTYKEFGIQLPSDDNDRNLWMIFERTNVQAILWGRSKKIHIDNVLINDSILQAIKERISRELALIPSISSDYIYELFKAALSETGSNICCKEALYGVLQYYFSEEFTFKKLTIKAIENKKSLQLLLEDYVQSNCGCVDEKKAKEYFCKWTEAMFNTALNFNQNVLSWDNGNLLILAGTLQLQENFISRFQEKIDDSFIEGYTNGYMIARSARVLLLKNRIKDDAVSVYSLAKHFFGDRYFFTRPHILEDRAQKQFTCVDLVLMLFRNNPINDYGDMKRRLINDFAINEVMAGNQIAKTMGDLFQLDIDKYCLPEGVVYQEDDALECSECIDRMVTATGYAILSQIEHTTLHKRSVEVDGTAIPINSYIAKSIVEQEYSSKYRFIVRKNKDWRNDNLIIVWADSDIMTFTDAIIYILKNEFVDKENFTLTRIENFLREKELIVKKIPHEFFNSPKVLIDEFGCVCIREEDNSVI